MGFSVLVSLSDILSLPVRLYDTSYKKEVIKYNYQRPKRTRLNPINGEIECNGIYFSIIEGVATISFENLFSQEKYWRPIYICNLHDELTKGSTQFNLRLIEYKSKGQIIQLHARKMQNQILLFLLEQTRNARLYFQKHLDFHPQGDLYFFEIMKDSLDFLEPGSIRNDVGKLLAHPNLPHKGGEVHWEDDMKKQDDVLRQIEGILSKSLQGKKN